MSYSYLDHEADIGIRCTGKNLKEAFEEGGRALFNLMVDPEQVESLHTYPLECQAPGIDTLFVEYLNEILSLVGRKESLFSAVEVLEIRQEKGNHHLRATLRGEAIDFSRHHLKTEVKAATYFGLEYSETEGSVTLQCVLDLLDGDSFRVTVVESINYFSISKSPFFGPR
jgi:SHS2 domain-containing protein